PERPRVPPQPCSRSATGCWTRSICRENARRHGSRTLLKFASPHQREERTMASKAVISLSTGMEDPEKVTVAFLVAVGAAESGRPTLMFLTNEAVRLAPVRAALDGVAGGVACDGCPSLPDLMKGYNAAGGRYYVCPICFNAKKLNGG